MHQEIDKTAQQREALFLLLRDFDFDDGNSQVNARPRALIENEHERQKVVFHLDDEFVFNF